MLWASAYECDTGLDGLDRDEQSVGDGSAESGRAGAQVWQARVARELEGAVRLNRLARTVTLTVMHAVMFMFIILYTDDFQRF